MPHRISHFFACEGFTAKAPGLSVVTAAAGTVPTMLKTSTRKRNFVAALAVAGLLAACGGGDDTADDNSSDSEDSELDGLLEYAECMREQGIDMADPKIGDDGEIQQTPPDADAPSEDFEKADKACDHFDVAEEEQPDHSPEELAELRDQAFAVAECMRERGWEDFADPEVDESGGISGGSDSSSDLPGPGDPDADQFAADHRECEQEAGV